MGWDTSLRKEKSDREIAELVCKLFEIGQTKAGIKHTLGGLYVYSSFNRVSKKALALIRKNMLEGKERWKGRYLTESSVKYHEFPKQRVNNKVVKEESLTIEHVVPIEALYRELLQRATDNRLTVEYVMALMPKLYVALIRDDENPSELQEKMPEGWWNTKELDPMDRYRKCGLGDEIWAMEYDCLPQ